jgi:hypothetical protein
MAKVRSYLKSIRFIGTKFSDAVSIMVIASSKKEVRRDILSGIVKGLKRRTKGAVTLISESSLPPQNSESWNRLTSSFDLIVLFSPGSASRQGLIFSLEARSTGAYLIKVIKDKSDSTLGCDFAIVSSLPGVFPDVLGSMDRDFR